MSARVRKLHDFSLFTTRQPDLKWLIFALPCPWQQTGKALDDAIASGKVGNAGVSNFKPHDWNLLQSAMRNKLITNQVEISVMATDAFTNGDLAFHQRHAISPVVWSPLGGGALFDESNTSVSALRNGMKKTAERCSASIDALAVTFLLAHPAKIILVMVANNLK
ncbi:MAG: aldo/keto reductase, partial [Salaquimonas sp.]